jgi:hypothetical protein
MTHKRDELKQKYYERIKSEIQDHWLEGVRYKYIESENWFDKELLSIEKELELVREKYTKEEDAVVKYEYNRLIAAHEEKIEMLRNNSIEFYEIRYYLEKHEDDFHEYVGITSN